MRVGASRSSTSENRNSISSARPFEWTLARQSRKSGDSVPKLTSMCQPASPGSSGDGNRTGNVPIAAHGRQSPAPDELIERRMQARRVGGLDERRLGVHAEANHGRVQVDGIIGAAPGVLPQDRPRRLGERARKRVVELHVAIGDELIDLCGRESAREDLLVCHDVFLLRHPAPGTRTRPRSPGTRHREAILSRA